MNRFARLVILAFLSFSVFTDKLWAAENGGGIGPQVLWQLFSFALLVSVLILLLRKPARSFLARRREEIKNALEQAARREQDLEKLFGEWERKLNALSQEISELHDKIRQEGEAERKRIIARAYEEADRIQKQAQVVSEQEVKKASSALKKEMVDLSVEMAEKVLRETIRPQDQERLVREYIGKMRELA